MRLFSLLSILAILFFTWGCQQGNGTEQTGTNAVPKIPFHLDTLQRRTFDYFWQTPDTTYAQVPDRWPTLTFSSIAATGFGLTSWIIGAEKGYITREQAADRTLKCLQALWNGPQGPDSVGMMGYKGWFYHFLTLDKAIRFKDVELSSIDTGLLMAGVLSAMSYFDKADDPREKAIRKLADDLYRRVEWDWYLNEKGNLSMGWHPEKGRDFLPAEWIGYNEAMVLLVMAMGSPTHPIPADCWERWCAPYQWEKFHGQEMVNFHPLFGHQYSHMYIDFKGIQDPYMKSKGLDYFENSRRATLANRAYCIAAAKDFPWYNENVWGLTACDGPGDSVTVNGRTYRTMDYSARGAAADRINDDGILAPTAAGGSYPFAPEECHKALETMWNTYNDQLVSTYGFKDAFLPHPTKKHPNGWFDVDYLGIDQGPILIQIENHKTGLVWNLMKKNPYIRAGLKKAGFTGGWLDQAPEGAR